MKSYFGMAYLDGRINKIKINKILNSPNIENCEEVLRFIVYHEMLHFSLTRFHNKVFREQENKFPNAVDLNSILDRIGIEFDIKRFHR
jgi:predicted SprT family Zn-dependent metalloprotease